MKKEPNFYYVYLITNTILNKKYIGSKICYKDNPGNDNYWGSSRYLNKDYKIYGKNNFIKTILKDNYLNIQDMLNGESEYMHEYNTFIPNGYNRFDPKLKKGFHTGGFKLSDTHREKISLSHKGKKISKEIKNKMRLSHLGIKNYNFGKHLSQEHKFKISFTKKINGDSRGNKNPNFGGKITGSSEMRKKLSIIKKEQFKNNPEYKLKVSRKGKKQPEKWLKRQREMFSGKGNPRYIQIDEKIIPEIVDLYVNKNKKLIEIGKIFNLSYFKIKKILIENNIKIIRYYN